MIGGHLNRDKLLERINQLGPDMNAARRMSVKVVRSGHTDRLRRTRERVCVCIFNLLVEMCNIYFLHFKNN